MSFEFAVLLLVYFTVGICTIRTLAHYRMVVAGIVYTIAFFVLFLYLPVYTGNDLLRLALVNRDMVWTLDCFRDATRSALEGMTPYLTLPLLVAIPISVFLCLSAVCVAITAYRAVRTLRSRRGAYRLMYRRFVRKIGTRRRIPKVTGFCQTFCRYNC